jgi:hypothetical protein
VSELGIAVGVVTAFARLAIGLQSVMPPMIWSSGNVRILPLGLGFSPSTLEF